MNEPWQRFRYEATVVSVYDGDTVTLNIDVGFSTHRIEHCRLSRINAPELRGDSKLIGMAARDYLRCLIPPGTTVFVQTIKDSQEKYGRYLAEIHCTAGCVNDLIVHAGHAEYKAY